MFSSVDSDQPRWYAVYTHSRHEKRVAEQLYRLNIVAYLPLYTTTHRWNNRRAQVELPLFPGYVFVQTPLAERLRVLQIPSVAYFVSLKGVPVPLADDELNSIRDCLSRKMNAEPWEYLQPGSRVRVIAGPLSGLEGVILRQNGSTRFVVSIDLIMRSMAINVEGWDLELADGVLSSAA